MSLYKEFVEEVENCHIIEEENAYIKYEFVKTKTHTEAYIHELYVRSDFRNGKVGSGLADKVAVEAREKGCKWMSCVVDLDKWDVAKHTMRVYCFLRYGFKIHAVGDGKIVMVKSLEDKK